MGQRCVFQIEQMVFCPVGKVDRDNDVQVFGGGAVKPGSKQVCKSRSNTGPRKRSAFLIVAE